MVLLPKICEKVRMARHTLAKSVARVRMTDVSRADISRDRVTENKYVSMRLSSWRHYVGT